MSETSQATTEKNFVWQQVELVVGKLSAPTRSDGWKINQDKAISVFVTFSKIYKEAKTAWYDINVYKLQEWLRYRHACVIFVADDHKNSFIVPAKTLKDQMDKSSRQPTDTGNFDIHIKLGQTFHITEFKFFDLMEYHLAYQNLLAEGYSDKNLMINQPHYKYEVDEPEDIQPGKVYYEGAVTQITVNVYERNVAARRACIQHFGAKCFICGLSFRDVYGAIGEGFIHVHHIKPLSEISEEYTLDPITDLRPVCPNCHAMVHRKKPAYSIQDIQEAMR